ncbi:hypothetical protein EON63_24945, partial [archaeon]
VLDMATSATAYYGLKLAEAAGQPIPPDVAYDAQGRPTTSAAEALRGAIRVFDRGIKGSHLALMVELLAGAFTGAAMEVCQKTLSSLLPPPPTPDLPTSFLFLTLFNSVKLFPLTHYIFSVHYKRTNSLVATGAAWCWPSLHPFLVCPYIHMCMCMCSMSFVCIHIAISYMHTPPIIITVTIALSRRRIYLPAVRRHHVCTREGSSPPARQSSGLRAAAAWREGGPLGERAARGRRAGGR